MTQGESLQCIRARLRTLIKIGTATAALLCGTSLMARAENETNYGYPQPSASSYSTYGSAISSIASISLPSSLIGTAASFTSTADLSGIVPPNRVVSITAGQVYTVSYYVEYASGTADAKLLVNPAVFGGAGDWVGIEFNPQTGTYIGKDASYPGTYLVSPVVGNSSWVRVALTFKATANAMASGAIIARYSGTTMNVWGYDFINSPYIAKHVNTINSSNTGWNQSLANQDNLSSWPGLQSFTGIAGRQGDPNTNLWIVSDGDTGLQTASSYLDGSSPHYVTTYNYLPKAQNSTPDTHTMIFQIGQYGNQTASDIALTLGSVNPNTMASISTVTWVNDQSYSCTGSCNFQSGVIDAGDMFLLWSQIRVQPYNNQWVNYDIYTTECDHTTTTCSFTGNVILGRYGVQVDGVFP
jgi:hypothetical protein